MTPSQHRSDHDLKKAITEELMWTPDVTGDHVGVGVTDGAVTLSGEVRSYPEKAAALQAALRVRGVTALADEITIKDSWGTREDADIARDAAKALDTSVVFPAGSVQATVHNHLVTLSGTVAWHFQREAARHAVTHLQGVTGVSDAITLRPLATFSPGEATTRITAALVRNAQIDAAKIDVSADGDEVRLAGSVSSWAERAQAEHAAYATPGVSHVDNRLVVIS